ncbi:MAG: protein TolQ [Alphaproteobacteria bacterium]|nr:protein TolQ [Alphaproteobacteria bacterium]
METQTLSAVQAIDFSLFALFWRASFIVKLVLLALMLSSFWSWAIIIQKFLNFRVARKQVAAFDRAFWSGEPLDELYAKIGDTPKGSSEKIFCAGMSEWHRSHRSDGALIAGVQARIDRSMDVAIVREGEKLGQGLTFLATVGSTAPFVGLFGTVWGITNAFQEIAMQQNTNLAVVAPGIAEALVATSLGLVAAIPAVIFYNKLSADANRISAGLDGFADEFATILSRQLDL